MGSGVKLEVKLGVPHTFGPSSNRRVGVSTPALVDAPSSKALDPRVKLHSCGPKKSQVKRSHSSGEFQLFNIYRTDSQSICGLVYKYNVYEIKV
ncbi:hypothetical protein EYF80_050807 [Liparis tanakae]|uniref:Uncharacterized protein n=1 Tax=Liparis tanakae TaxID=230148 RepID=A0A4Z2FF43_9TELE|nr:hypothetical protein EYF80_050807 [Liparis tanakae]